MKRFVIIGLLFHQLKRELDGAIVEKVVPHLQKYNLVGEVAIVSDAGSALGKDLVKQLHGMNATVVMGCADVHMDWCSQLAANICETEEPSEHDNSDCMSRLIPLSLDLAEVDSVEAFSATLHDSLAHLRTDYLVLNGDTDRFTERVTKQGHDITFGAVYLGQLLLVQLLRDRLLAAVPLTTTGAPLHAPGLDNLDEFAYRESKANAASRVVFVGSSSSLYGDIEPSLLHGAAEQFFRNTGGLNAAHFALTMSAFELQRGVDVAAEANSLNMGQVKSRRMVTSVVNSGYMSLHKSTIMAMVSRYVLRSVSESNHVVLYAMLSNNYVPSSYIDSYLIGHDLFNYHADVTTTHLVAYPSARTLKFNLPDPDGVFRSQSGNIEDWYFKLRGDKYDYRLLAGKLWKASAAVLGKDF